MPGELAVLLCGRQVAQLVEGHGHRSLHYVASPGNTPVSLSMPIQAGRHGNRVVESYLNGLLPDRPDVRAAMGREFGVSGNNPFALLRHAGLDCAGAVQFCEADRVQEALALPGAGPGREPAARQPDGPGAQLPRCPLRKDWRLRAGVGATGGGLTIDGPARRGPVRQAQPAMTLSTCEWLAGRRADGRWPRRASRCV